MTPEEQQRNDFVAEVNRQHQDREMHRAFGGGGGRQLRPVKGGELAVILGVMVGAFALGWLLFDFFAF